jgi:hypothetical protein
VQFCYLVIFIIPGCLILDQILQFINPIEPTDAGLLILDQLWQWDALSLALGRLGQTFEILLGHQHVIELAVHVDEPNGLESVGLPFVNIVGRLLVLKPL